MMDKSFRGLLERLEEFSKGCEDKCLDMQSLKFESKESEMRLYTDAVSYYFKTDPEKPKHPKVVHGTKQFCKIMGIPYSFFIKNPEYMRNQMVSCWLPALKEEKAAVLAKLRKTAQQDKYIIRALLPVEFTNISNYEIMSSIANVIGDDFNMWYAIGDGRDDLLLNVRFVSKETFEVEGEVCTTGFSVTVSELGAVPISVDTMLFRLASKSAMIGIYSGESYFETDYEGIQPSLIKDMFPQLVFYLKNQLYELKEKVQSAKELLQQKDDTKELLRNIRLRRGLNEKFHNLLFQEVEENKVSNRWDFVTRISILAKEFDPVKRVNIEKLAGELIGLIFEKI